MNTAIKPVVLENSTKTMNPLNPNVALNNWQILNLPSLSWISKYKSGFLRKDLLAGLALGSLVVPEGLALASLSGIPPAIALFTIPIAMLLYAIFGSSKHLVIGASATTAVLSASIVASLNPLSMGSFIALSASLALLVGLISILAGVFKLSKLFNFFSPPILLGFVSGTGFLIVANQLPLLFGLNQATGNFFQQLFSFITSLNNVHALTLLISVISVGFLALLKRFTPNLPASLIVLSIGALASAFLGLHSYVGTISSVQTLGLKLPGFSQNLTWTLLIGALGITLINFSQSLRSAKSHAANHNYRVDPNQELIGLGASNIGVSLFQGFPMGVNLSHTSSFNQSPSTPMARIFAALIILASGFLFLRLISFLPQAVLAALVIGIVFSAMKLESLKNLYFSNAKDFTIALITLIGVLFLGVMNGLIFAVAFSLLLFIWHYSHPGFASRVERRSIRLRPKEQIFFANADSIEDQILKSISKKYQKKLKVLILDLKETKDWDAQSLEMVTHLNKKLKSEGINLKLANIRKSSEALFKNSGANLKII